MLGVFWQQMQVIVYFTTALARYIWPRHLFQSYRPRSPIEKKKSEEKYIKRNNRNQILHILKDFHSISRQNYFLWGPIKSSYREVFPAKS